MKLKDLSTVDYDPITEQLLQILRDKTQNLESDQYFRILIAFYFGQMAASMRVNIAAPIRGEIPIPLNVFACCLAPSGTGKGHSMNIMEREIIKGFRDEFVKFSFPRIAEQSLDEEATRMSDINGTEKKDELVNLTREYRSYGSMPYSFDSGTSPAFKEIRTKAQMAKAGALNMIVDEIGTNLLANADLFGVNLEAYDAGLIKQKIIKNTSDNVRAEDRDDPVPSNMLIMGTPSKLFNGGKEEQEWDSLQETGYSRRLFFAVGTKSANPDMTAEDLYDILTNKTMDANLVIIRQQFARLAVITNHNIDLPLTREVSLILLEYQLRCELAASKLSEYQRLKKTELMHRHSKALKLAGIYAFVNTNSEVTVDNMYAAIKLTEDSGEAYEKMLTRDRAYARLAKYIAEVGKEVTHADIQEDLPFYPTAIGAKTDMMNMAISWGYRHNIIVKKSFMDGIEFFEGEALEEVDLQKIPMAFSLHPAYNFLSQEIPFDKMHILTQKKDHGWINHTLADPKKGHRIEDQIVKGFSVIAIDCDKDISYAAAKELLTGYKAHWYKTKRHQVLEDGVQHGDRFRIIIPMKYKLYMDADEYKEFMKNLLEWLPFPSDDVVGQRARKWSCHPGENEYTEGELLDPRPFIPKTAKNEERKTKNKALKNMGAMERFFASQWAEGGRNKILIRYGLMLQDAGKIASDVQEAVMKFNGKFGSEALPVSEVMQTVIQTIYKRAQDKK